MSLLVNNAPFVDDGTFYMSDGVFPFIGQGIGEAGQQYVAPKTGTISLARGRMRTNTRTTITTVTLNVNGVATGITFGIPAGDASDFVFPGSVAVTEGDLISWEVVAPAGAGAIDDLIVSSDFD